MKNTIHILFRALATVMSVGCLCIGGMAQAAEPTASTANDPTAMNDTAARSVLRDILANQEIAKEDRYFRAQVIVQSPGAHANIVFCGVNLGKDDLMHGRGEANYGALEGSVMSNYVTPFYMDEQADSMNFYFLSDDIWKKFMSMTLWPKQEPDELLAMVKDVKILQETAKQRTIAFTLDSKKLGQRFDQGDFNKLSPEQRSNMATQAVYFRDSFAGGNDIPVVLTVDRQSHRTMMLTMDFSRLLQGIAFSALAHDGATMDAGSKGVLAGIREYCEVKLYKVYVDDEDTLGDIDIPSSVKSNAKSTE